MKSIYKYISIFFFFFFFNSQSNCKQTTLILAMCHEIWAILHACCNGVVAVLNKWVAEYGNMILEVTAVEYHRSTLQSEDNRKGWMCSFSGTFSSQMSKGFSSSLNALIHIHIFPTPLTYWKKLRVIHTWLKRHSTAAWDVFQAALVFQRPCCCDIMQLLSSDRSVFIIAKSF